MYNKNSTKAGRGEVRVYCCMGLIPYMKCMMLLKGRLLQLFGTIVNGIVALISVSNCSLLVNRSTIEFCVLAFYPATLNKLI